MLSIFYIDFSPIYFFIKFCQAKKQKTLLSKKKEKRR